MTHASPEPARRSSVLPAAWAVLLTMGLTSAIFNVYHAYHDGHLQSVLAFLAGVAPVIGALGLSHIGVLQRGSVWLLIPPGLVMAAAMTLSISAIAAVVAPVQPGWHKYLFGFALDGAAAWALVTIVLEARRRSEEQAAATARAVAKREAAEAQRHAEEVALRERQVLRESEFEKLEAELAAAQEAARVARSEARSAVRSSRTKKGRTARPAAARTARAAGDDWDAGLEAMKILAEEPGLSGAKLGLRVGRSKRWGQEFKRGLVSVPDNPPGITGDASVDEVP
jgi:hypothetical protein